ncbi:MAG: septum site-determining protein MinC [Pseudomonadota bacterium]|nr:septum site-determining protein MinC [Pseudomonadota bacterium]
MAVVTPASSAFELKSAALTLVAVVLKTVDLDVLERAFQDRFADAPELFANDPVAIDLTSVSDACDPIDFSRLIDLLRGHKMLPVAVRGANPTQLELAVAAGLAEAHGHAGRAPAPEAAAAPPRPDLSADAPAVFRQALVVDRPLRSGQRVYAKGTDLIVLAVVSHGAEVIADGNIHVYAPLRGRALAGAMGDAGARIFTTCMEPQLLSIAGIYRTTETELPPSVLGKPAQVRLEGEKLVVEALKSD